ncbi:MAG TPA: ATP-binding protein [Verrucomicrobiae bacterium]|nr:ATP-binding protein [Verrucomicrobiae bacterium]
MGDRPQLSSAIDANAGTVKPPSGSLFGFDVPFLWVLVPLILILTYLVEFATPLGMTMPVCYIAALILIFAVTGVREKILVAATCTILIGFDYFLSLAASAASPWMAAANHGLGVIIIWVIAALLIRHRRIDDIRRKNERVANERLALINTVYASAPVGLCFLDRETRFVSINDALAEMVGQPSDYFLGKTVRQSALDFADGIETHCKRVIETRQPVVDIEVSGPFTHGRRQRRHWLCSFYPVQTSAGELLGVNVAVRDITRRKQAEADTLFLLDLGECIRFAANPDELMWAVAIALGEHLGVNRCGFVEIDAEQDRLLFQRDYHPHVASIAGLYRFSEVGPAVMAAARSGQVFAVNDVAADHRTQDHVDAYRKLGIGALVATPMIRNGTLVSGLAVAMAGPHDWSDREATLVSVVAERTWLAVEKLRLDNILRETDKTLRDADRRKDEFLATLAHELRNPLSLIRNVVTLQKTPDALDYDARWGQDIIDQQVSYLTRLTDDLIDVSRITRDKLVLQKERANLSEIIKAAVESSRPFIDERRHRLTVDMPDIPIVVDGDRVRLTQVFMNLLNNAAKYSPDPGHIQLVVEPDGDAVVIRIKDTGIGIAAENLPRLFDLFYQVDRSYTRAEGGLGLGLTLVRRLVEMHGGKVKVRSEGLNRGSEFLVRLPVLPLSAASHKVQKTQSASHDGAAPLHRRILVADDFPESAATLARLLQQDGNEVRIAEDGIEALEVAERFRPEIALLDIAMPKLNGYDTARRIREQPWGKKIILIALTGWGQQQDRQHTQAAGFDAHLTKPVNYDAITEVLAKLSAGGMRMSPHEPLASASKEKLVAPVIAVK